MRRLDVPEIEDYPWCPGPARDASTSFLALLAEVARPYDALAPKLANAIRASGATRVIDLASGAGGPWRSLRPRLAAFGADVEVLLTDRYPHRNAALGRGIRYHRDPVDATAVPRELAGFRTVCGAFHHFPPRTARALLADAVGRREGVAVLEAVRRDLPTMAMAALLPLPYLAVAPALRPFRWSRMLWSYLLPAAPALLAVDGVASCIRAYAPSDLLELTSGLEAYAWEAGVVRGTRVPIAATYLIGVPT